MAGDSPRACGRYETPAAFSASITALAMSASARTNTKAFASPLTRPPDGRRDGPNGAAANAP